MSADHLSSDSELCPKCQGDGVLPLRNEAGARVGVQTCPACDGRCWAPAPAQRTSNTKLIADLEAIAMQLEGAGGWPRAGLTARAAIDEIKRLQAEMRRAYDRGHHDGALGIVAIPAEYGPALVVPPSHPLAGEPWFVINRLLDPYHDEAEWLKLPIRERLSRRIVGSQSANTRGCITQDLIEACAALDRGTAQGPLDAVLTRIYESEINCAMISFWDGGWTVKLGDRINGYQDETECRTVQEAADWLVAAARKHYPTSQFVRNLK